MSMAPGSHGLGLLLATLIAMGVSLEMKEEKSTLCHQSADDPQNIYNFTEKTLDERRNISLSEYSGKVVLVVNVATY